MSFQLSILTPAGKVYENTVDSLLAPGLMGGFEVYTNHAAMLCALKEGQLKVKKDGTEQKYKAGSGILEVKPDHSVMILIDAIEG